MCCTLHNVVHSLSWNKVLIRHLPIEGSVTFVGDDGPLKSEHGAFFLKVYFAIISKLCQQLHLNVLHRLEKSKISHSCAKHKIWHYLQCSSLCVVSGIVIYTLLVCRWSTSFNDENICGFIVFRSTNKARHTIHRFNATIDIRFFLLVWASDEYILL